MRLRLHDQGRTGGGVTTGPSASKEIEMANVTTEAGKGEGIVTEVRRRYAEIAVTGSPCCGPAPTAASGCCGGSTAAGLGLLEGVIMDGWRIGARVRVRFQKTTDCGGAASTCFKGTIRILRDDPEDKEH